MGYKRIAKVVQGHYEILAEKRDGGFFAMEWYNVAVKIVGGHIELKMKQEKGKPFDYEINTMDF